MSKKFGAIPQEGCDEDQRARLPILESEARELGESATLIVKQSKSAKPPLAGSQYFLRFRDQLDRFETRRKVMGDDLEQMRHGKR